MKKLLFSGLLGMALISFTECDEYDKTETKKAVTTVMKCEEGKYGNI